jgi:hypothetical protein
MGDDWQYTAAQLASALGITVGAVWQAVRAGNLPHRLEPIGKPPRGNRYMLVFSDADLERYRREHLGRSGRPQKLPTEDDFRTDDEAPE